MRRIILLFSILFLLASPVGALELEAPEAPDSVADIVPEEADSFAEGLWNVIRAAIDKLDTSLSEAAGSCLAIAAAVLLCSLLSEMAPAISGFSLNLACTVAVAGSILSSSSSLIALGMETAAEISEYGKLLLPVMTSALAAQGGTTASTALYVGTAFFDSLLSTIISKLMIPLLYLFLGLSVGYAALGEDLLAKMRDFVKWAATWILKIVLYSFTGYMTITGAVSGSTDAAAVKAAKITISGAVPVVGGILSDATETVLAGMGVVRSAIGIYGLLTVIALFLSPFLRIGIQYLLLKAVGALCGAFNGRNSGKLLGDFSAAMGLLLAMVSTQTVLLLISTVCFMKGVG